MQQFENGRQRANLDWNETMQIGELLREEKGQKDTHSEPKGSLSRIGHERGLLLVGLFKLTKAIFFTAVGAGALHLVNKNVGAVLMHVIDALRIDPEGRFVTTLMDHVGLIDSHELRRAGLLSFLYAVICVVEGVGLMLEKRWAEYFTVILTALGLPWESYKLVKRFSPYEIGLLAINLVVLLYVLWILKKKRAEIASS